MAGQQAVDRDTMPAARIAAWRRNLAARRIAGLVLLVVGAVAIVAALPGSGGPASHGH